MEEDGIVENWIYVGIFLDMRSKRKLQKLYQIPDGWTPYFDHMTVVFNDHTKAAEDIYSVCKYLEGNKYKLQISGSGIDGKAYAVSVNTPAGVPSGNAINHITLATSPKGKPVDSNNIANWSKINTNRLFVTGTLKIFRGNN